MSDAGGEPFEYQSCTHQHDIKGSMEGSFEFVEGTLSNPTGGFFDVEVSGHTILVKGPSRPGWMVRPGLQA